MINVPISICINKGISQVYFLFISPKSTKHIPPNINILQCEYPRQKHFNQDVYYAAEGK